MPNCFQLTKIGDSAPSKLADIDNDICRHLGINPHPKMYAHCWVDIIGYAYAMGETPKSWWAKVEKSYDDHGNPDMQPLSKISKYLAENYTSRSWAER